MRSTTPRSMVWAMPILLVCLLAAWRPFTGKAPIHASLPSIVLHLSASDSCKCLASTLVPTVDTYSVSGSVCISIIANPETPEDGVCVIPSGACEDEVAKKCQVVWNFTLQVGNTPNPPCNFGARVVGASAPSGLCLPGHTIQWSHVQEADCRHANNNNVRLSIEVKDNAQTTTFFTCDPGMDCKGCPGT